MMVAGQDFAAGLAQRNMNETPGISSLIMGRLNAAEMKRLEKEPKRVRRVAQDLDSLPQLATCGNCAHISYHGIMEVKLEWGDCEMHPQSSEAIGEERFCVRSDFKPCPFWQRRSLTKQQNERAFADKMTEVILELNTKLRSGVRSLDALRVAKVSRPRALDEGKPKKRTAAEALALLGLGVADTAAEAEDEVMEDQDDE